MPGVRPQPGAARGVVDRRVAGAGVGLTGGPPAWWVAGFYVGMGAGLPPLAGRPLAAGGGVLWVGCGATAAFVQRRAAARGQRLQCTMLDVGHGNCVLLQLPGGETLLYDAGQLGPSEAAARRVSEFLWSQRVRRLDAVLISHTDADHFNALPESRRFSVGCVYLPEPLLSGGHPAARRLSAALRTAGVE